jgi:hypothetical protein
LKGVIQLKTAADSMPPKIHEAPSNQQRVLVEGKVQRYFPKVRPEFAASRADDDAGDVRIGERRSVSAAPSGKSLPQVAVELDLGRRVKSKAEIIEGDDRMPTERFRAQIIKEESDDEEADAAQRRRDAAKRQPGSASALLLHHAITSSAQINMPDFQLQLLSRRKSLGLAATMTRTTTAVSGPRRAKTRTMPTIASC